MGCVRASTTLLSEKSIDGEAAFSPGVIISCRYGIKVMIHMRRSLSGLHSQPTVSVARWFEFVLISSGLLAVAAKIRAGNGELARRPDDIGI